MSDAEVTRAGDRDEGRLDAMAQPCRDCEVGEPHVCHKMPREAAREGDRDEAVRAALDEVERRAARHAVKRRSFVGVPVESVSMAELTAIVREVRDRLTAQEGDRDAAVQMAEDRSGFLLQQVVERGDRLAAVEALLRKWERSIGPGSGEWADLDVSTMQVPFVVQQVRAVLADSAGTLAKAKAQTLRDAADEVYGDERAESEHWHPLSIASWLRERADRVEAEAADTEPTRTWPPCAVWPALNCLCRSGLNSRAATCTRKREAGR